LIVSIMQIGISIPIGAQHKYPAKERIFKS